ncbi:MAG: baseplate J/gp47 family protein [Clostridiaceae bacterium]|nr:baseplate J/gp47 family protein [Clostridiaceae bacterium]
MDWKKLLGFKTFDELVDESIEKMKIEQTKRKTRITNFNIGGRFRTLLELASEGAAEIFKLLLKVIPMGFLRYAKGVWLDLKAEEYGVYRLKAKPAIGQVVFTREGTSGNTTIPAGTLIKTETMINGEELRYFTIESAIIVNGESSVSAQIKAEEPGQKYNVFAGMISKIISSIPGVSTVSNLDGWIVEEGADEESDDSLRERCYLRWEEISQVQGGAFEFWAREISGVMQVKINDQHPRGQGTIDIIITGPEGYPSQSLIDQVQAHIEKRKYICANPLVKGPIIRPEDISITIYLPQNEGDEEVVQTETVGHVRSISFKIGSSLYTSEIVYLLKKEIPIIKHVVVNSSNVIVQPDEIIEIDQVNVMIERVVPDE